MFWIILVLDKVNCVSVTHDVTSHNISDIFWVVTRQNLQSSQYECWIQLKTYKFAFVISSVIFLTVWRQTVVFKMISIFESYISLVEKIQIMDSILSNQTCKIDTEYIYPQTDSQTWESDWYMKWLGWKIM